MKIRQMFEKGTVFSFEIFPPKKTSSIDTIYNTLEQLRDLKPDFISVTFGAGGSSNNNTTCEIAQTIKEKYGIESAAHLPCINYTKEEIVKILGEFKKHGISNILALRGDINPDIPPKSDFKYASDLISFIKQHGDFDIAGACYPEGHVESEHKKDDIAHLKQKVDCGVDFLTTQMFFDNNILYNFLYRAREKGVTVPVIPGIMPVTNANQVKRILSMSGTNLPERFKAIVDRFGDNPKAMQQAGIAYATDQIIDLFANGINHVLSLIHISEPTRPY